MPPWARVADADAECSRAEAAEHSTSSKNVREPAVVSLRAALFGAIFAACLASVATLAASKAAAPAAANVSAVVSAHEKPEGSSKPLPAEDLFRELDAREVAAVALFVAEKLNCSTRYLSLDGCFLSGSESVSLKPPPKWAALAHLDGGADKPPRMAQAIVVRGDAPEQFVGIYDVGPLDDGGRLAQVATVELAKSLDWNYRPLDMSDSSIVHVVDNTVSELEELVTFSFGPIWYQFPDSFKPNKSGQVTWLSGASVHSSLRHRSSRVWFNWFLDPNEFQVSWLHTLPFSFDVLHDGAPEKWRAENVSYCGQFFPTAGALLEADKSGRVQRCKGVEVTNFTWDVPGPDTGVAPRDLGASGPELQKVKKTWQTTRGGSVRWGDWEFVATVRPASGLALHEVRWLGERVVYELALSDAHAYYSGPSAGKQFHYSDKAYSMMQLSGDMVEGLDCPPGATFLDGATWIASWPNATFTYDPALAKPMKLVCVFESPGYQGSSWRHTQMLNRRATGRRNRQLVVRAIGTVGNYDYITEVRFGEDGAIQVGEEFAGYPEMDRSFSADGKAGAATTASERKLDNGGSKPDWGSVVHTNQRSDQEGDNVQLLHAHFALFKVDLDIHGTVNEFLVTKSSVSNSSGPLPKKVQVTSRVEREDNATLFVADPHAPGLWRIVNPKAVNQETGTPKGYAIQIGSSPAVQTLPKEHPFSKAGSFARRHLTVTRRKDKEPTGVHSLDFYALTEPIYSIDGFQADEESLVGEDLVCWVSIGKDHIGRAEDQPLVSNFGAFFTLSPWNYRAENPQMQLDMVGEGPEEEVDLRFLFKGGR